MDHQLKGLLKILIKKFLYKIIFSLGVEPVDHDVLKRPPRKVTDSMINKRLIVNMVTSAAVIVIGTLCVFYAEVC
jgi:magnesium-transporting ATPase (P-type)